MTGAGRGSLVQPGRPDDYERSIVESGRYRDLFPV